MPNYNIEITKNQYLYQQKSTPAKIIKNHKNHQGGISA